MSLKGRVVLITGASSGIGAAAARLLTAKGAIPVLTARSVDKLKALSSEMPGEHAIYPMDVTDMEQVQRVAAAIHERFGRLDILLNNAGYGEFIPFADASLEHFQVMMDVNYMGVVRCCKAVLPYMVKAGQGHIVNVASIAGKIGSAKSTAYSATKHAVLGLTDALRQELRGTGILVSAVNPGPTDTPFFDRADLEGTYARNVAWIMMPAEKVARAIVTVMERRIAEKDLPWLASAGVRIRRTFPRWTEAAAARLLNKK
ncbi:SDR family NAD(P)-dependent oxidoreductase [Cohnella pontilimi]|uniref:SDR family NAD(P)-dependent oxidoreductase n=1 Tax=Cohnella pontilimi TaxID=2564100 RepID=A0A4U0F5K7_9BACL|nr:SDR family NAD(P)-dependent oxidoreductase [Cohnella pontilimi]TJY39883.1 SDR family NAD(P)-dependent oxidoreductase [Cohnella pontilimi]